MILIKTTLVEVLEIGYGVVIDNTSTVGYSLTYNVYQIIFKIVISSILFGYFQHQSGSFCCSGGVVVVLHLRPTGNLEVGK